MTKNHFVHLFVEAVPLCLAEFVILNGRFIDLEFNIVDVEFSSVDAASSALPSVDLPTKEMPQMRINLAIFDDVAYDSPSYLRD